MSYYYSVIGHDFARALAEAQQTRTPTNATLLDQAAYAEERLGQWDSAVVHMRSAVRLDPRDASASGDLGLALMYTRRHAEARTALDRALAITPGNLTFVAWRVMASLGDGDLADAQRVLHAVPPTVDPPALLSYIASNRGMAWVLDDTQRRRLLALPADAFDDGRAAWAIVLAQAYASFGDGPRSRAYADTARAAYQAAIRTAPDRAEFHGELGVALAYLGRDANAVREGQRAVALVPLASDGRVAVNYLHQLARIYTITGQSAPALDVLDTLLAHPGYLSAAWLRIDPTFASLRGNPRFDRLTTTHRPDSAAQSSRRDRSGVPTPAFAAKERHPGRPRPLEIGDQKRDAHGAVIQAVRMRGWIGGGDSRGA